MPPLKYQTPSSYVGKKPAVKPPAKPAVAAKPKITPPKIPAKKVTSRYSGPPAPGTPAASGLGLQGFTPPPSAPEQGDYFGGIDYQPDWGGGGGGTIEPYSGPSSALLSSQSAEDLGAMSSSMTSKIRQALVDLGLTDVSQLTPDAQKYLDQATLTAAGQNKYSLFGQIATTAAKATAQQRAKLAAQGMLSSGALTKSMQDIVDEAEQKRYAGVREFSGSVGDLLAQYAQRQRDWASRIAEARFAEAQYAAYTGSLYDAARQGGGPEDRGAGLVGRPGEWADLPVAVGYDPVRNADAQYDMSGATKTDWGYIGPQGQRYDDHGRVI